MLSFAVSDVKDARIFITNTKVLGHARVLHPQAHELSNVLMGFLSNAAIRSSIEA